MDWNVISWPHCSGIVFQEFLSHPAGSRNDRGRSREASNWEAVRERERKSRSHPISTSSASGWCVCVAGGKELSACCQQPRLCFVLKIVVPYLEVMLTEERRNEKSCASLQIAEGIFLCVRSVSVWVFLNFIFIYLFLLLNHPHQLREL